MTSDDPYFGLRSAPRADAMTVSRLVLEEIRSGRLRVPEFQRELRWKSHDNVKLFDSILRGYPIGSLLLWQKEGKETDLSRIGAVQIRVQARTDAWFVVDGQQRLTALAGAMLAYDAQKPDYKIWLDYREWKLRAEDDPELDRQHAIPISTLVDTAVFRAWSRKTDADDATLSRMDELAARIRNYTVPIYFVETADEDLLRDIFMRMNSTGARMAAHEVFQALRGGRDVEAGHIDLVRLRELPESLGFGTLDNAELLKIVLGTGGLDPSRRPETLATQDLEGLPRQEDVEEALFHVVDFLTNVAGMPHVRLLPYPAVLAILGRFFHLHPNPDPVNREALVRWIWRGAATGAHQRGEVTRTRESIRDIVGDEQATLRNLLRKLTGHAGPASEWTLDRFHAKNARSRIEMVTLLEQRPQYLPAFLGSEQEVTGGEVTLGSLVHGDRLATEVVAASAWDSLSEEGRRLASTAANRVLLQDRHTGMAVVLRQLDPDRHAKVLRSHLLSTSAFHALKQGDYDTFLRERGRDVSIAVKAFLDERTRWERQHGCTSAELELPAPPPRACAPCARLRSGVRHRVPAVGMGQGSGAQHGASARGRAPDGGDRPQDR